MRLKLPRIFLYLLALIFILNILQAHFTELIFDEAYYWYYAQNMAWGYFDHPPMVALIIKISSLFFGGELGVRFISTVLSAGTYLILWFLFDNQTKNKYVLQYFVLVFSMTLVHAYGFLTLPDTPLLFFTALFLLIYKKFLKSPSVELSLILGFVMAALMYSKYHAFLVILFVLLSNLRLVFNKYAWLSVLISLICYTPHFLWLFNNDFITIKYHLFERPNRAYEFGDFTVGFFVNLIVIFGLTFPWIYRALLKTKTTDKFTKAILFLIYGIIAFFFISSFNRRIQTQWLIVICIPMIVVVYNKMLEDKTTRKWIHILGITNIGILLFLRIGLIYPPLFPIVYESHGNKDWVNKISSQVGSIPVIFENSYTKAPMYSFYSGNTSYSLNNITYRPNQFTIDNSENVVQGQKIVYISKFMDEGDISYHDAKGVKHYGIYIDNFESFRKLRTIINEPVELVENKYVNFQIYNPYKMDIEISKLEFGVVFLNKYKNFREVIKSQASPLQEGMCLLKSKDTTSFKIFMPEPKINDAHFFKISISENGLFWGINGENVKLP
ncbi:glycosyltransferase family 39 protein [uncultured Eudoraea sp.]|uniref:ArnT family glycosyltransferase n=1 Tax=uncultured Eudoraea sp. TaxID=1035614 RepID=UPI002618D3EA|nr:glycosyltransferase family 39 protein [uncultured Eudoraea sp.]